MMTKKIKIMGLDTAIYQTGLAVVELTKDMEFPEIIKTRQIVIPSIQEPTNLDTAKRINMLKNEIRPEIMSHKPNVVGMERHQFSTGFKSDFLMLGNDAVIMNLFFDLKEYLVVKFPVLIAPIQLRKWVDCSRHIKDAIGKRLTKSKLKQYYIKTAREKLGLNDEISGDEVEALIICHIVSAWAMPESRFAKSLTQYQQEVIDKIKQEGETEIDGLPGFYEDNSVDGRESADLKS